MNLQKKRTQQYWRYALYIYSDATVRIAKNIYLHHCYLHNKDMLDIRMKKFYCEKTIFDEIAAL